MPYVNAKYSAEAMLMIDVYHSLSSYYSLASVDGGGIDKVSQVDIDEAYQKYLDNYSALKDLLNQSSSEIF